MDIPYDLINTVQRTQDAIAFNVADWSLVAYLPGRVNFTGHTRTLSRGPMVAANVTFALQTLGAQARVRALYYNAQNQQIWTTLGTAVHQGPNDVQLIRVDIKAALDALFLLSPYCYVTTEVNGAGSLFMSRLEINWDLPDWDDFNALVDRVEALEAAQAPQANNGVGYDDSLVKSRISTLETRLQGVRLALD
jgi:hypothetical protein